MPAYYLAADWIVGGVVALFPLARRPWHLSIHRDISSNPSAAIHPTTMDDF